jgi:hypothetical protein
MPRKSITLNGFAGGLNKDASTYDIISEGQGKDEIPGNIDGDTNDGLLNCYIDDKGKATTAFISPIASTLAEDASNSTTSVDLVINNDIAYRNDGVYSIGNDVNWSGNTDYQAVTPTEGRLNVTPNWLPDDDEAGRTITLKPIREDDLVLFLGESAKGGFGRGKMCWEPGNDGPLDLNNTNISDPTRDDWRNIVALAGDGDDDGVYNSGDNYFVTHLTGITDTIVNGSSGAAQLIKVANNAGVGIALDSAVNSVSVDTADRIVGYRTVGSETSTESDDQNHIVFRGGQTKLSSSTYVDGYFGHSFPNIDGKDIAIEIKLHTTINLNGIYIWADAQGEDQELWLPPETTLDAYSKIWFISTADLVKAGCVDDYQRIIIPEGSDFHVGSSYNSGDIRRIGMGATHSANIPVGDGHSDGDNRKVWSCKEFAFIKARVGIGWNGKKLKISQSFTYNKVEGLTREYVQNDFTGVTEDATIECCSEKMILQVWKGDAAQDVKYMFGNFYYQEIDDDGVEIGSKMLLAKYKPSSSYASDPLFITFANDLSVDVLADFGDNEDYASGTFDVPPLTSTYDIEAGYPSDTSELNALWKASAVVGRQVYIGNIKQPTNASAFDTSKILKAPINKPAGFSDKSFIDIELGGTEIKVMETSGDRLFVFTKTRLVIINVAQDIEFLEATMDGYGVRDARKVIKIAEGLAFVNGNGVHYFDGQKMTTLTDEKMSNYSWGDSYAISYFHPKKLLIIWRGDSYGYMYSFRSNSWCNKFALPQGLSRPNTNSVTADDSSFTYYFSFANNANDAPFDNELLVLGETATGGTWGDITDGINSSSTPNIDFRLYTGFIDCGSPGRRKRFYKFKVRVINARYLKWDYRIIGENLNTNSAQANYGREESSASGQIAGASIVNGTVDLIINDATVGKQGTAIALRIYDHYNTGESSSYTGTDGPGADMIIEDITLIYREKTVK